MAVAKALLRMILENTPKTNNHHVINISKHRLPQSLVKQVRQFESVNAV